MLGLVIVELRYRSTGGRPSGALLIGIAIAVAFGLRRRRIATLWPYILIGGSLSWWGLFLSGLHPALALLPIMPFLTHAKHERQLFADVPTDADDGLSRFGRLSRYPVQVVLLCFALVNAGAVIRGFGTGTWAVAVAALAGKPVGVLAAVALAVWSGLHLPPRVGWKELTVVALTTSIGFTFALFFATAAIPIGPSWWRPSSVRCSPSAVRWSPWRPQSCCGSDASRGETGLRLRLRLFPGDGAFEQ